MTRGATGMGDSMLGHSSPMGPLLREQPGGTRHLQTVELPAFGLPQGVAVVYYNQHN